MLPDHTVGQSALSHAPRACVGCGQPTRQPATATDTTCVYCRQPVCATCRAVTDDGSACPECARDQRHRARRWEP